MTNYVDTFALHKKGSSAQDCMGYYMPKPPSSNPGPQAPGRDISDVLGEKQIHKDRLDQARLEYRCASFDFFFNTKTVFLCNVFARFDPKPS